MLFKSYTSYRLAKLVYVLQDRGLPDPLNNKNTHNTKLYLAIEKVAVYNNKSNYSNNNNNSSYNSTIEDSA